MNAVTLNKIAHNYNQAKADKVKADTERYFEALYESTLRPLAEKGKFNADVKVSDEIDRNYFVEFAKSKGFKLGTRPNAPLGTVVISW